MRKTAILCSLAACPAAALAQLHTGDIAITGVAGSVETGVVEAGSPVWGQRVFDTVFGELPNWTNDPGFDSPTGAFPSRTELGFDIMGPVLEWDGMAFDGVAESRILISKGRIEVETPDSGMQPGFVFGVASTTGKFHHHVGFELLAPASDGVYLLELVLWDDSSVVGDSEPFFIIFGQNATDDQLADAVAWVETSLIGEPCRADMDGDGSLTIFDFLEFQNSFDAGDASADFDGDGSLTIFDFLSFQNEFDAGC